MQLSSGAMVRLLSMLNNMPIHNRGTWKAVNELASRLEFTDEEKTLVGWTPIEADGRTLYRYQSDVLIERELSAQQIEQLRNLAENPPEGVPWRRSEMALYNEVMQALGGETFGEPRG